MVTHTTSQHLSLRQEDQEFEVILDYKAGWGPNEILSEPDTPNRRVRETPHKALRGKAAGFRKACSQAVVHTPLIPALWRLRWEDLSSRPAWSTE